MRLAQQGTVNRPLEVGLATGHQYDGMVTATNATPNRDDCSIRDGPATRGEHSTTAEQGKRAGKLIDKPHMILIMADRANESAAVHAFDADQPVPLDAGCLFCGRPWGEARRSDEHVLPQWMRKHETDLLKSTQTGYSAGFDLDDQAREFIELPTLLTTKKSSLLALKTRAVCADCNNGWMSRLEEAARPLIRQLAGAAQSGQPLLLTLEETKLLAVWCQKTAATYELTSDRPEWSQHPWASNWPLACHCAVA